MSLPPSVKRYFGHALNLQGNGAFGLDHLVSILVTLEAHQQCELSHDGERLALPLNPGCNLFVLYIIVITLFTRSNLTESLLVMNADETGPPEWLEQRFKP